MQNLLKTLIHWNYEHGHKTKDRDVDIERKEEKKKTIIEKQLLISCKLLFDTNLINYSALLKLTVKCLNIGAS